MTKASGVGERRKGRPCVVSEGRSAVGPLQIQRERESESEREREREREREKERKKERKKRCEDVKM